MARKAKPIVSSKAVIRKIYRDLKPNYDSWVDDAYEWIGEAMELIGTTAGFVTKEAVPLTVKDFRAPVPCDFYEQVKITYRGEKLNKIESENVGNPDSPVEFRDQHYYPGPGYKPDMGYYRFTFESAEPGEVKLWFKAFLTDSEGLPMVPNTIEYKQALFFYCLRQMILQGYVHKDFNYDKADAFWDHYCTVAANDERFPSVDDAERMMRWWTDMVPRTESWRDDFADFNFPSESVV